MKLISRTVLAAILAAASLQQGASAQNPAIDGSISIKSPGNPAETFCLAESHDGILQPEGALPVEIKRTISENGGVTTVKLEITAEKTIYYRAGS